MSPALELSLNRLIDAPRERVWPAWTEPAVLKQWWSPLLEADVRPNGVWKAEVVSPDGSKSWSHGAYLTVDPPNEVSYTFSWEASNDVPTTVTITLADNVEQTEMTVHQTGFISEADRDAHIPGWDSALDELESFLAKQSAQDQ